MINYFLLSALYKSMDNCHGSSNHPTETGHVLPLGLLLKMPHASTTGNIQWLYWSSAPDYGNKTVTGRVQLREKFNSINRQIRCKE